MNDNKYTATTQSLEHLLALLSADRINQPKEVQELFYFAALRRFSFFWFTFLSDIILDKDINFNIDGKEHPFDIIMGVFVQNGMLSQEEADECKPLSELYDEIIFYQPNMILKYEEIFKELCKQTPLMKMLVKQC